MNILVAVDLSSASEQVADAAAELAARCGAKVYVVHVSAPEPDFVGYESDPPPLRLMVAASMREEHREVQKLADRLREAKIDATALLVRGPTVEKTLDEAKDLNASLIVVGTHGHGAVYNTLVGSYSAAIIRKSPIPVLVVPTR